MKHNHYFWVSYLFSGSYTIRSFEIIETFTPSHLEVLLKKLEAQKESIKKSGSSVDEEYFPYTGEKGNVPIDDGGLMVLDKNTNTPQQDQNEEQLVLLDDVVVDAVIVLPVKVFLHKAAEDAMIDQQVKPFLKAMKAINSSIILRLLNYRPTTELSYLEKEGKIYLEESTVFLTDQYVTELEQAKKLDPIRYHWHEEKRRYYIIPGIVDQFSEPH